MQRVLAQHCGDEWAQNRVATVQQNAQANEQLLQRARSSDVSSDVATREQISQLQQQLTDKQGEFAQLQAQELSSKAQIQSLQ